MRQVWILSHGVAREGAVFGVKNAPDGFMVIIQEPRRNLDQSAKLHALIGEIAKSRVWAGKKWDTETWKRLLIAAYLRTKNEAPVVMPAIDGAGMEIIYKRSSELTRKECSELIDYIEAWQLEQEIAT